MHSSRMRTGRALTVFRGGVPARGVYLLEGVYLPRGSVPAQGVYLTGGGCTWPGTPTPPPVNRMTDTCKNITLAKTSFRPVTRMHSSRMRTARCNGHFICHVCHPLPYMPTARHTFCHAHTPPRYPHHTWPPAIIINWKRYI